MSRDNRRTHRPLGLTSTLWHNGKDKQEVLCVQRQSQHKPAELTTGASIHEHDWAKHLKEVLLTPPRSVFTSPVMQSCSYNAASWRHNCLILACCYGDGAGSVGLGRCSRADDLQLRSPLRVTPKPASSPPPTPPQRHQQRSQNAPRSIVGSPSGASIHWKCPCRPFKHPNGSNQETNQARTSPRYQLHFI